MPAETWLTMDQRSELKEPLPTNKSCDKIHKKKLDGFPGGFLVTAYGTC